VKAKPAFDGSAELTRYIDVRNRLRGNFADSAAFYTAAGEGFLSVNSTEVERTQTIANRYCQKFESADAAVCIFKVAQCNGAARDAGIPVSPHPVFAWSFPENAAAAAAYRHYWDVANPSHCGIEFVRIMTDDSEARFARRMVKHRFQLLRPSRTAARTGLLPVPRTPS
jgi:hypothetical protein